MWLFFIAIFALFDFVDQIKKSPVVKWTKAPLNPTHVYV